METVAGLLLGLAVGSAVAGFVSRPEGTRASWLHGRSACPACGVALGIRDLVPILSWLALRGRCRRCGAPIAVFYPLVEATAFLIAAVSFGVLEGAAAWLAAGIGWWLLMAASIDLRELRLPDLLTLPLAGAGLLLALAGSPALVTPGEALLGAVSGFTALAGLAWAYERLRGRAGLGLGDAKLLAAAGAWLGPFELPMVVLLAALVGLAHALAVGAHRRPDRPVPFGPALTLAFWLRLLQGLAEHSSY